MKKLLRLTKRIANTLFGTVTDKLFWQFRHFIDPTWAENYISTASLSHPHRILLMEKLFSYAPIESAIELGCASGPNLILLAEKFPMARLKGIDISREAIENGREYLASKNIKNVTLEKGDLLSLKKFKEKSFDIVFADAVLIYVNKKDIKNVIKELVRIAKKAVVLVEWNTETPESVYVGHWAHNYRGLFKEYSPKANLKLTKVDQDTWAGDWAKYGYIIEAKL